MLKKLANLWKADNLLQQAWDQSFEMLEIDRAMFLESVRILRESDDANFRQEIREKDKIVNKYEREVRRKVITHCTIQGPTSIPAGMVLVSIIIDIERIGDFAKNLVDLAERHPEKLHGGLFEERLKRVEDGVKDNFGRTRECLEESDEEAARALLEEYKWINKACDEALSDLILEKDKTLKPGDAVALALYFRWLKRTNAHLRNITTSVVNPFDRIGYQPKDDK
ncbi:PhoU domain-containing protein [Acidobacteriota bacterium]